MRPDELRAARHELGLTLEAMATLLGYQGHRRRETVYKMERGLRPIREPQRRLVEAHLALSRPRKGRGRAP